MPSQKQLRWSELTVGITVVAAAITLAVLVFLMSGTSGMLSPKLTLTTHFDNAEGLKSGQPVQLSGVPVGNVTAVRVVQGRPESPVEVVMKVNSKFQPLIHKDSVATIKTAGLLGESYIDLDSRKATDRLVKDGDEITPGNAPGLDDVVRASQGTLQNMDILVKRLDRIVAQIESGKGTLGQVINDPTMMNKVNGILNQVQGLLNDVSNGKGTIGKLFTDETMAKKLNNSIDKINLMIDETESGKNNIGRIMKDETLYNNIHQAVANTNKFTANLNSKDTPVGKLTQDQELAKKLENTVNRLSAIADKLDKGEGSLGQFLQNPSFYNNSDQLLIESRNLVKAMRENPKKYLTIHLRIF